MSLGDHLRSHQHIHFAGVDLRELQLQAAAQTRAVGIDARYAYRVALGPSGRHRMGPAHFGQQFGQVLLQTLGPAPHRSEVQIAALGAGARNRLCVAAVVAAQRAVRLVEDPEGAAVRAAAFPVAGAALQYRRVAAAVQKNQALLASGDALADRRQQGRRNDGAFGLLVHVDLAHLRQLRMRADAAGHAQPRIASALVGAATVVPALERRGGRAQHDPGVLKPSAVNRQIACRVARTFLLLVTWVVLFVDNDELQMWQGREDRHACTQHDPRHAAVRGQPAPEPLRMAHAAVHGDDRLCAEYRAKAFDKALLQLRRQVDFGDHHQGLCLRVAQQQFLNAVQVDLGLSASGGSE